MQKLFLLLGTVVFVSVGWGAGEPWHLGNAPLRTRWDKDVSPEKALPEYPRPQMERTEWLNLNGLWDYAVRPKAEEDVKNFEGKILVPYPVESALSGVMKVVGETNRIWYRREFTIPKSWNKKEVLL